jgi:hypothetical protein
VNIKQTIAAINQLQADDAWQRFEKQFLRDDS